MKFKFKGATIDALSLTFVRIIAMLISMVTYKLLAVTFSLEEYGLYSSATLVSTTLTSITILGLTDAMTFFYTKEKDSEEGRVYANTIVALQFIIGGVSAVLICLFKNQIAAYFNNPAVAPLIPYVALIPLFTNIFHITQVIFITEQKAKVLAVRSLIISFFKVFFVILTCWLIKDIKAILCITLLLDFATAAYMLWYCRRKIFRISLRHAKFSLTKEILSFSIPMSAYIITSSLTRDIDKLIIGSFGNAEELAVYSIASKVLPFDILTTAFFTVLVPYITRFVHNKEYQQAGRAFSKYLQLSYTLTWIIATGALACSRDLMLLLYDKKYLVGLSIFCIYILVDMMKFANVSLIFSITCRAKELLCYSVASLALNWILNIVFYNAFGLVGPALSTILITFALSCIIMKRSSMLLHYRILDLLNIKYLLLLACECLLFGSIAHFVRGRFLSGLPDILAFGIAYIVAFAPLALLNIKKILRLLKEINALKMS